MITALLSADQAEVLLLRVLADLDVDQVAAIVQRSPNWVRVTQHQTMTNLAKRLGPKDCCNAMSDWDDLEHVTPRISSEDAERLLSGTSSVDETDELADVSAVLGALRRSAEPDEFSGLDSALAAFGAAVVTAQTLPRLKDTPDDQEASHRQGSRRHWWGHPGLSRRCSGIGRRRTTVVVFEAPAVVASTEVPDESTDKPAKIARDTTPTTEETDAAELNAADEATPPTPRPAPRVRVRM